jgi:hypothetical protein
MAVIETPAGKNAMDDLIKAMIGFSWAMSLFGIKQLANVVTQDDSSRSADKAARSFDSVTRAAEAQCNDSLREAFKVGDRLQSGMTDLAYSLFTLDTSTPRRVMKVTLDMMQLSAETLKLLVPGQNSRVVWQEFKNKLQAFDLFEHVDSALRLPLGSDMPLAGLIEKAAALDSFAAVWATEGVGHYHTEVSWEQGGAPRALLAGDRVGALPATGMAALHAGMGLSLANRVLDTVNPQSPVPEIRSALKQFVRLCKDNSQEGYIGAAYESLGLVARNLYPEMVQVIDQQLSEVYADLLGYFWHGVGRAIYFAPTNFLPCSSSPWRAIEMAGQEPPHELGRLNALAGLGWAVNLVNIRQPEIIETVLKLHGDRLSESDAFSNGVMSSIMIWRDSTRHDLYITRLCQYQPDTSDPHLVERWNRILKGPCEAALQHYYDVLKQSNRIGEVFRYQSLPELVARLESA